jgi:hypothetical protein
MNIWGELNAECMTLHVLLYDNRDVTTARMHLPRLKSLIDRLPDDDDGIAIIRAESLAIYHELQSDAELALFYRRREVELMHQLYEDIRLNNYDDQTKRAMLVGRDINALAARNAIIRELLRQTN